MFKEISVLSVQVSFGHFYMYVHVWSVCYKPSGTCYIFLENKKWFAFFFVFQY